jgi:peptidase MA superfamily protein
MDSRATPFPRIALAILTMALLAFPCAADHNESSPPDAPDVPLEKKSFEQLSERAVSRSGERALDMKTVQWEHYETEHFIFHTEAGFSTPQLANSAEMFYASIKKDLGITEDTFERKSHIYVFLSEPAWRDFTSKVSVEQWTGGFCTGRELFFQTRANYKFQGTTLPHEMTHLALYRFVGGDIPLWLNEGFAEFEGGRLFRFYLKRHGLNVRGLSPPVTTNQYVTVDTLTRAVDYPSDTEDVKTFYAESERLVNYLYTQAGGMTRLTTFIKRQSAGSTFESSCRDIYQFQNATDIDKKFLPYATKE